MSKINFNQNKYILLILVFSTLIFAIFIKEATIINNLNQDLANENTVLKRDLENLGTKNAETEKKLNGIQTYKDDGLPIELEYPTNWYKRVKTEIDDEFLYSDSTKKTARGVRNLEINLEREDVNLNISVVLTKSSDSVFRLTNMEYEYAQISPDIIRYRPIGSDEWIYSNLIICEGSAEFIIFDNMCSSTFLQTKSKLPIFVTIDTDKLYILKEADLIVQSIK